MSNVEASYTATDREFRVEGYEKPQRGRYRQFDQVGIEVLGADDPYLDVEVIALTGRPFSATMPTRDFVRPTLLVGLRTDREVLDLVGVQRVG